jgi:hypothetical protein
MAPMLVTTQSAPASANRATLWGRFAYPITGTPAARAPSISAGESPTWGVTCGF